MSAVRVLTPAGSGAIATVEVAGPRAWEIARRLFRPAGSKPLPETPELHRFWFGKLADGDEVVLAVKQVEPEPVIEVHCHGGRRVVRWVVEQFLASGGREPPASELRSLTLPARQLSRAPTLRTASILLDQYHGAFERAGREIIAALEATRGLTAPGSPVAALAELARFAPVGRHLVEPWKVAIAGPPNVGKSSLVNALAGYQRSVVSEVAGTTRDVVTVQVAFDGWPVELADTAGLREADGLEAEGIEGANRYLAEADLVLWVIDATDAREPDPGMRRGLLALNKCDFDVPPGFPDALRVSARTGEGIPGLAAAIARTLVPDPPPSGTAIPYTSDLADRLDAAARAATPAEAAAILRACLELR